MSRQHYSVKQEVADRFEELLDREDGESATDLFRRACDRLEADTPEDGTDVTERNGEIPENVLTTDHVPDIVAETSDEAARKTLDGIDDRRY